MTTARPKPRLRGPKRSRAKTDRFHVTLRKRKDGVHAQIKHGMRLIHECDPAHVKILYDLVEKWTDNGVDVSRLSELREIQHEAAIKTEFYKS